MFGDLIDSGTIIAIVGAAITLAGIFVGRNARVDDRLRKLEKSFSYREGFEDALKEKRVKPESKATPVVLSNRRSVLLQYTSGPLVVIGIILILVMVLLQDVRIGQKNAVEITKVSIVSHTPGLNFAAWDNLHTYAAPRVPEEAATYLLGDILSCPVGYQPVAAWHEIVGSWPSHDAMYSVNADVTPSGEIQIALRSRQSMQQWRVDDPGRGYSYVEVFALCRS